MHMIDNVTQQIVTIPEVLKVIDDKYDHLKDYYAQFAIENVLVRCRFFCPPSVFGVTRFHPCSLFRFACHTLFEKVHDSDQRSKIFAHSGSEEYLLI